MATFRGAYYTGNPEAGQIDYLPTFGGVQDGDIIFSFSAWADAGGGVPDSMGYYDGSVHPESPPGWLPIVDELVGSTWFYGAYKIAGPSEVNQTFVPYVGVNPAWSVGFAKEVGVFVTYYDYDGVIDTQQTISNLSALAATSPSLTPSRTASRLITFHAVNADPVIGTFSMSTPAGMTLRTDTGGTGIGPGYDPLAICVSDQVITGTSPIGTRTSTPSAGSVGPRLGWSILLPSGPCTPVANDNWDDAIDLGSTFTGSESGNTACSTAEGDLDPAGSSNVWYRWTAPAHGTVTFTTTVGYGTTARIAYVVNDFSSVLDGELPSLSTLGYVLDAVRSDYYGPADWITFLAQEGVTYWIIFYAWPVPYGVEGGLFSFNWLFNPLAIGTGFTEGGWVAAGFAAEDFFYVGLLSSLDGDNWNTCYLPSDGNWTSFDWILVTGSTIILGGWIFRSEFGASESIGLIYSIDAGQTWQFPNTPMFHKGRSGPPGWSNHSFYGEYTTWSTPGVVGNGRIVVGCEISAGLPNYDNWYTEIISCPTNDPSTWTTATTPLSGRKFAEIGGNNGGIWFMGDRFFTVGSVYEGDSQAGAKSHIFMSSLDGITWTTLPTPSWSTTNYVFTYAWNTGTTWLITLRWNDGFQHYSQIMSTDHGLTWSGPMELIDSATSGFEDGTIGLWPATVPEAFTLTNSTEHAHTGTRSLKIVSDFTDTPWTIATGAIDVSEVPEGALVSIGYWYYLPGEFVPGQHLTEFYIWDGSTLLNSPALGDGPEALDTWVHKVGSFTMFPNAQDLYIEMNIYGDIGDARYFDDFSMLWQTEPTERAISSVATNGNRWVSNGGITTRLAWSNDGITWTDAASPFDIHGRVFDVYWDGSAFWASGDDQYYSVTMARSINGLTWTAIDNPWVGEDSRGSVYGVRYIAGPACTPPPNDNWSNAEILVGSGGSIEGTLACASVEINEPGLV